MENVLQSMLMLSYVNNRYMLLYPFSYSNNIKPQIIVGKKTQVKRLYLIQIYFEQYLSLHC